MYGQSLKGEKKQALELLDDIFILIKKFHHVQIGFIFELNARHTNTLS